MSAFFVLSLYLKQKFQLTSISGNENSLVISNHLKKLYSYENAEAVGKDKNFWDLKVFSFPVVLISGFWGCVGCTHVKKSKSDMHWLKLE